MKKIFITVVIGLLIGTSLGSQTFRGTPKQLRVNVDSNGYLSVTPAAQTLPVTQVQFSNARLAVDSSGSLIVNCLGCEGTGTIEGSIATGQVAFGASADTIAGSSSFKWHDTSVGSDGLLIKGEYPILALWNPSVGSDANSAAFFYQGAGYFEVDVFPTGDTGVYLKWDTVNNLIQSDAFRADRLYGSPTRVLKVFPGITDAGFLQAEVAIPTPNSDEYSQTAWLITAHRDSTDGYFDANFRFGATVSGTIQVPTYSFGSEGNLSAGGALTHYRAYLFDQVNDKSIWHIDDTVADTFIFDNAVNTLVSGGTLSVHGAEGADGLLQIASDQGDDATDTWQLKANGSGNALTFINNSVTSMTIIAGGAVKFNGGTQSSDGTAGATTTCTLLSITAITVKNGLVTGCS